MGKQQENHKPSVLSIRDIFLYIQDKLSGKKRNALERRLLEDPFEEEAIEGYSGLKEHEASEDLAYLKATIRQRSGMKSNKTLLVWQLVAAVFLALVFVTGIWLLLDSDRQLQIAQEQNRALSEENSKLKRRLRTGEQQLSHANIPEKGTSGKSSRPTTTPADQPAEEDPEGTGREQQSARAESKATPVLPQQLPSREPAASTANDEGPLASEAEAAVAGEMQEEAPAGFTDEPETAAAPLASRMSPEQGGTANLSSAAGYRAATGYVRSEADNGPVAGVRISPIGLESDVYTKLDGSFEIILPSKTDVVLRLQRQGYIPSTVKVGSRDTLRILLRPDDDPRASRVIIGTEQPDKPAYDPPTPLGGRPAFTHYMETKLPPSGNNDQVVRVRFVVAADGSVGDMEVLSANTPSAVAELVERALEEGPPWYPAERNGNPVPGVVDLRIRY